MEVTLNCVRGTPTTLATDCQTLHKLSDSQFLYFTKFVFNFLSSTHKSQEHLSELDSFSKDNGIAASSLKSAVKAVVLLATGAIKENVSAAQLRGDLLKLEFSEERADQIVSKWVSHHDALSSSIVSQTLSVNQLVDMEWKFGVTAASSDISQVGTTFVQLKLVKKGDSKNENVYLELSLPQFYAFLHEMEKARASLDYFN